VDELLETRKRLNTSSEAVAIVHSSRMEPWKGHRLLLKALSLLASVPNWTCWVAGAPQRPSEEHYFKMVKEDAVRYRIADRVRFTGWEEDITKLLAAAQIHCQPNTAPEPFGITFVEAMSAGLPVVTTSWGGPLEIVTGESGILVAPDDPDSLATSLEKLITDPGLRAKLGAAGRNSLAGTLQAVVAQRQNV
jgi:glycosyltransferase involved in cell wall biosynthesis